MLAPVFACGGRDAPAASPTGETRTTAVPVAVDAPLRAVCDVPDEPDEAAKFSFDSATLSSRGEDVMALVAACFLEGRLPGRTLKVIGFADPRGPETYNRQLGLYRAVAAKLQLVELGVPEEAIVVESRGEGEAAGAGERAWATQRRVEVHLVDGAP